MIAELPQEHWNALVGRGIDPIWIPTDGRDGLDLFEYTHHTATEGNMLRSLHFTWEVSRAAMQFYVEKIHTLVDIHPRRLVMIAQTIRDNPDPDKQQGSSARCCAARISGRSSSCPADLGGDGRRLVVARASAAAKAPCSGDAKAVGRHSQA